MASIPVTIIGVMTYTDVGVGGGPMPGGPEVSHPIAPGGQPGYPAHPIAPGGQPPGIWGGAPPYVDIGGPGPQPGPSHPIVIPPDSIAPGVPTHPIYIPVFPMHPIVIPPGAIGPGVPTHPIVLPPPAPSHPIVIPPDAIEPGVPEHPIVIPPPLGIWGPGQMPPGFWGGGMGPGVKPQPPGEGSPPAIEENWDWVYSPYYGWVVQPPGEGGKPQPGGSSGSSRSRATLSQPSSGGSGSTSTPPSSSGSSNPDSGSQPKS
ncbi:MAG TPA: hypothetical protein VGN34_06765 [Ktedonobacteraceae bacterium]